MGLGTMRGEQMARLMVREPGFTLIGPGAWISRFVTGSREGRHRRRCSITIKG